MKRHWFYPGVVGLVLIALVAGCSTPAPAATIAPTSTPIPTAVPTDTPAAAGPRKLILATTTSTDDSGLLDNILPDFEQAYNVEVDVIAVGTGQALKLGEDGNADVLLVHARAREDAFMEAGHGVRREDVMYNDFVIVGPAGDPAGIQGMASAAEALARIAETGSTFVSRGDDSGTHTKEKDVWKTAGIEPAGDWYVSAGQGMGAVLGMADEQQAYTLSDRATYLARVLEGLGLEILVEGDPVLFNPYGVIAVNPNKGAHIQADLANTFIDWLISVPTQEKIARFGVDAFGSSLFMPDSGPWREAHPPSSQPSGGVPAGAAFKVTGKVENEIGWTEDQMRAMAPVEAQFTNKQGETTTYTGVAIKALLELARPQAGAGTLVYVADDGYTAEVALSEVMGCDDCIVSFQDQGGLRIVMPDFAGNLQVKGAVEIQVK